MLQDVKFSGDLTFQQNFTKFGQFVSTLLMIAADFRDVMCRYT